MSIGFAAFIGGMMIGDVAPIEGVRPCEPRTNPASVEMTSKGDRIPSFFASNFNAILGLLPR